MHIRAGKFLPPELLPASHTGIAREFRMVIRCRDAIGGAEFGAGWKDARVGERWMYHRKRHHGKRKYVHGWTYLLNVDVNRRRRYVLLQLRKRGKVSPVVQKESPQWRDCNVRDGSFWNKKGEEIIKEGICVICAMMTNEAKRHANERCCDTWLVNEVKGDERGKGNEGVVKVCGGSRY